MSGSRSAFVDGVQRAARLRIENVRLRAACLELHHENWRLRATVEALRYRLHPEIELLKQALSTGDEI